MNRVRVEKRLAARTLGDALPPPRRAMSVQPSGARLFPVCPPLVRLSGTETRTQRIAQVHPLPRNPDASRPKRERANERQVQGGAA